MRKIYQLERPSVYRLETPLAMLANVFVIVGIFVALVSVYMTRQYERRQNAISAINTTRSSEFLKAYSRLKTVYNSHHADDSVTMIDDLNFVMNTYDNMALLYLTDSADRCLLKNSTHQAVKEILVVSGELSYPPELQDNVKRMAAHMEKQGCE